MAFVFYDTETTGTNWPYDQIVQFAAVRTDVDLKPIDEIHVRSRLLPHVVPSPEALKINGLTPQQLMDPALPSHYQMVRLVRAGMRTWASSMFVGFNNLGLDENMLRAAFYKTLHPPYLTVTNGNARADVLKAARAAHLLSPGALKVPVGATGAPTFNLADLARANGFNHTDVHDARGDVKATIHLAGVLMNEAPTVWNDFMRFARKSNVLQHIQDEAIFGFAEFYKGRPYTWLVTRLGNSASDKNVHYVYDLQFDPDDLAELDDEQLRERLVALPRPIKRLKANACPVIFAIEDAPPGTEARLLDDFELERRTKRLRADPSLARRLINLYEGSLRKFLPSPYVEQQIFEAFTNDGDWLLLDQFHAAPWSEREAILANVQDARLRALGEELIYLEDPSALTPEQRASHLGRHKRRLLGLDGQEPCLTLPAAIESVDFMLALAEAADSQLETLRAQLIAWRDQLGSPADQHDAADSSSILRASNHPTTGSRADVSAA